jgi:hypothetical protein
VARKENDVMIERLCPIIIIDGKVQSCIEDGCAWWLANDGACSVPFAARNTDIIAQLLIDRKGD